jgi:hypothetical protein
VQRRRAAERVGALGGVADRREHAREVHQVVRAHVRVVGALGQLGRCARQVGGLGVVTARPKSAASAW